MIPRVCWFFSLALFFSCALHAQETVVCIHGFMGGKWSMVFLAKNLKKDGHKVVNWCYPSRNGFIADHGSILVKQLQELVEEGKPIHFVVHSMGGLVLQSALAHPDCPKEAREGRVVLIASPVRGAQFGRYLKQFRIARFIAKDLSGHELMTKEEFGSFPKSLDKVLVITGNAGFNPFINGENDGIVGVSETDLEMPHDRILVKRGHKMVVYSKKVLREVRAFLR